MLLCYSKLIELSIASIEGGFKIGDVYEVVLSPYFNQVEALVLRESFFDHTSKVISKIDVVEITKEGVVVNSRNVIFPLSEIVKVKKLVDSKYFGIRQKVFSQNDDYIGKVFDYIVDGKDLTVKKIIVKKGLKERIIPAGLIVKFDGKRITVKDNAVIKIMDTVLNAQSVSAN